MTGGTLAGIGVGVAMLGFGWRMYRALLDGRPTCSTARQESRKGGSE